jgi:hypothetical protein
MRVHVLEICGVQRRLHWLPMFEEFCGVQRRLHWLPCLWRFAGVQRRLYLRRLRDLRGAVWTTVLATPVELYIFISLWGNVICYYRIGCIMSSPLDICDCSVWCNRHRDCLVLELGLHSCSAMNWVSGLRFSIPYLTGRFPCRSPLLISPFQVRPTSRSDFSDRCYWAFGLLSFYRFYRYRASRPLDFYRYGISYFGFSVYVVSYVSDFILYYGIHAWMWTFKYLYMDI